MKPINKSKAFASLSHCLDVLDIIQQAEIPDLQSDQFFVKKSSFSIAFNAQKWHTVAELFRLLRQTRKLDPNCHRVTPRPSNRRGRATADLPLIDDGIIHIYARNDCFDSEEKDPLYQGYTAHPKCQTREHEEAQING